MLTLTLTLTLIYYQIYDRLHPRNDTPTYDGMSSTTFNFAAASGWYPRLVRRFHFLDRPNDG